MIEKKKHNSLNQTENVGGRPSKLPTFLEAMAKVLNEGLNSIIMTDEELFIMANEFLEGKDKIGYTTFKEYKADSKTSDKELYKDFSSLYKKALIKQKGELFKKLEGNEGQWQKYAWIIERKFTEWNLRQITDNTNKNANVNYEADDSEEFKDILKDNGLI